MKKLLLLSSLCLSLLIFQTIQAQNYNNESPSILPVNPNLSPLFGNDIVINNLPDQDQHHLAICSAQKGWLYTTYVYDSLNLPFDSINLPYYSILRSKDNGLSWTVLYNHWLYSGPGSTYRFEILTTGDVPTNQKLFIGDVTTTSYQQEYKEVYRFNIEPFAIEASLYTTMSIPKHGIGIACDNNFPAINSNPGSLGLLLSTTAPGSNKDSLVFYSSDDGGLTLKYHQVIKVTNKKITKVALAYGRSLSQNAGQYFAVWEEKSDTAAKLGHIYTAHTSPNFNSAFTTPVMLDGLDPSLTNLCRNPVIACQANNVDNDSTNMSEIILFEKYNSVAGDYDVTGFFNKKAFSGTTFNRLNIATTPNNELQPDITFNSFDSMFVVTYYDSTAKKLPSLSKNLNLTNPNTWNIISSGYNEIFNLVEPKPRVTVNEANQKVVYGWTANRNDGHGVALFDAPYIPAVGIAKHDLAEVPRLISVYPNPCNTSATISFEMKKTERIVINLFNLYGQPLGVMADQAYQPGMQHVKCDLSGFQNGIYFFTLEAGISSIAGKICVIR